MQYDILSHGVGKVGSLQAGGFVAVGPVKEVRRTKTFTAAQIKALRASPQVIIESHGTGTLIVPVKLTYVLIAGTNVLSESAANLVARYVGQASPALSTTETTGWLDQATSRSVSAAFANDLVATKAQADGLGIEIFNNGAGEFAGNAANDARLFVAMTALVLQPGW